MIPTKMKDYGFYWILDFDIPNFKFLQEKLEVELMGKVLIVSKQLWSFMRGEEIRSALIGPGIIHGNIEINDTKVDVTNHIGLFIFDPTQMRLEAPIPVVDIINPEVIDPLAEGDIEELSRVILDVVVQAGQVLATRKLAEVRPVGSAPRVYYKDEFIENLKIKHVSGIMKAKFVLGGQLNYIYKPFLERFKSSGYDDFDNQKIFWADKGVIENIKKDDLSSVIIVEKMQGAVEEVQQTGYDIVKEEYESVVEFIKKNERDFLL